MKQSLRVSHHPVLGEIRYEEIEFTFDEQPMVAHSGDVIATALLANGIRSLGRSVRSGKPRALYCAIGHCFQCQLTVDGQPGVRACITRVAPGMHIESEVQIMAEARNES